MNMNKTMQKWTMEEWSMVSEAIKRSNVNLTETFKELSEKMNRTPDAIAFQYYTRIKSGKRKLFNLKHKNKSVRNTKNKVNKTGLMIPFDKLEKLGDNELSLLGVRRISKFVKT